MSNSLQNPNSLQSLAAEYMTLRTKKGHFSGGGTFDKDVDGFNGKKHVAMKSLLSLLGATGTPALSIMNSMGVPDEILLAKDNANLNSPSPLLSGPPAVVPENHVLSQDKQYLVYYWRGRHDFIWFLVESGAVVLSDFYQAGE